MIKKITHYLGALTALLLIMMVGCKSANDPYEGLSQIKAEDITLEFEGGEAVLGYSVKGSSESVTATTSTEWISNFDYSIPNQVRFIVERNTTDKERKGEIILSSKGTNDLVVEVMQYCEASTPLTISLSAISSYSAEVTFTPNSLFDENYLFLVMKKSDFDAFITSGGENALVDSDLEWLESLAEANAMTLKEFLPRASQVYAMGGEETVMSYNDLSAGVDYCAYCYGLSLDGRVLSEVISKEFRTEVIDPIEIDFDFSAVVASATEATISVSPSDKDVFYFWTHIIEAEYNKYGDVEIVKMMTANLQDAAAQQGKDLTELLIKGDYATNVSELWPNSNYYVVAWAMDERGTLISNIHQEELFTTDNISIADDCTFEVTCPKVEDMDIQINIKPSNADTRYYIACISDDKVGDYTPQQMSKRIIDMENNMIQDGRYGEDASWGNVDILFTGEQTKWANEDLYWTFKPDNLYHIYVFGVDENGVCTTEVSHTEQKSASAEESEMTFEISVSEETWYNGLFKFTPSNDEEYYVTHLMEKAYVDEYFRNSDGSLKEEELMEEIEHYYDGELNYYLKQGETEVNYSWSSDNEFIMLAFAYAGTNTSKIAEFVVATPPIPFEESEADLEVDYQLFDGDELYAVDPDTWKNYQGSCVMYMQFSPNEIADKWYAGVWLPVTQYERGVDELMHLIQNRDVSFVSRKTGIICPWWENTWSLSFVAADKDGKLGEWHYSEFTPVKAEAEEVYDFWSAPAKNSGIYSISKDVLYNQVNYFNYDNKQQLLTPVNFESKVAVPAKSLKTL